MTHPSIFARLFRPNRHGDSARSTEEVLERAAARQEKEAERDADPTRPSPEAATGARRAGGATLRSR